MRQILANYGVRSLAAIFLGLVVVISSPQWSQAASLAGLRIMKQMAQEAMPYERAIANSKPTLLEFYADWCPICQSMAPSLQALSTEYGSDINFVMLNVDDPQWWPQINRYQVTGVPHFVALEATPTPGGQPVVAQSLVGQLPPTLLSSILDNLREASLTQP